LFAVAEERSCCAYFSLLWPAIGTADPIIVRAGQQGDPLELIPIASLPQKPNPDNSVEPENIEEHRSPSPLRATTEQLSLVELFGKSSASRLVRLRRFLSIRVGRSMVSLASASSS
jgi:hypothetical protein